MEGLKKNWWIYLLLALMYVTLFMVEWSAEGDKLFDPGSCVICGNNNPEDYAVTGNGETWCYKCAGSYCRECRSRSERLYGGRCLRCLEK